MSRHSKSDVLDVRFSPNSGVSLVPIADDHAGSLPQIIIAGTTQTVRSGFSVISSLDAENGELATRADYAGRVDLHLERRAGLGRTNALYLDQG
jgi:hypothetical protein